MNNFLKNHKVGLNQESHSVFFAQQDEAAWENKCNL